MEITKKKHGGKRPKAGRTHKYKPKVDTKKITLLIPTKVETKIKECVDKIVEPYKLKK